MATLPEIGAKATNGSNAIPEAGSSWPSWSRASEQGSGYPRTEGRITHAPGLRPGILTGYATGLSSDVLRNSDVWYRDRPGGVACDWQIQGQKHAALMLQAYGLGSSQVEKSGRGMRRHTQPDLFFYTLGEAEHRPRKLNNWVLLVMIKNFGRNFHCQILQTRYVSTDHRG